MSESTPTGNMERLEWSGERYVPHVDGNIRLEHLHRYLLAREWCRGRRVLDIACGEGYGCDLLAPVALSVVGVDNAHMAVAHARRQYGRRGVAFAAGGCAAIPLRDRSVDLVVSFETIEHHDQHDEMMREFKRVLAPGGLLVISSPDRRQYSDIPGYTNPFHVKELYREEFEDLLRRHFTHVAMAGQRVKAGSLLWPLETGCLGPFDGYSHADDGRAVVPLDPPMYLVAAASDDPVPPMRAGLLDGGTFFWKAEVVETLDAEGRRYAEAMHLLEAQAGHANANLRRVEEENAALRQDLDSGRQVVQALEARVEELSRTLTGLQGQCETLTRSVEGLEVERRKSNERREAERRVMAQLDAERRALDKQIQTMERSHSWRLTAPLRALRRAFGM
jgi:SAM-dependent methyltransferase